MPCQNSCNKEMDKILTNCGSNKEEALEICNKKEKWEFL